MPARHIVRYQLTGLVVRREMRRAFGNRRARSEGCKCLHFALAERWVDGVLEGLRWVRNRATEGDAANNGYLPWELKRNGIEVIDGVRYGLSLDNGFDPPREREAVCYEAVCALVRRKLLDGMPDDIRDAAAAVIMGGG